MIFSVLSDLTHEHLEEDGLRPVRHRLSQVLLLHLEVLVVEDLPEPGQQLHRGEGDATTAAAAKCRRRMHHEL